MVKPTLVVIEGFTVVPVDNNDSLVHDTVRLQRVEERLNAGIHIGNRTVILRDDVVLIRNPYRHPRSEVIAKRLEGHHRFHRLIARSALVTVVEHPFVRRGRQIGRVRIHVSQEQEKRFTTFGIRCPSYTAFGNQPIQFWHSDVVEVLRFRTASGLVAAPACVVEVSIKPARTRPAEADATSIVTCLLQHLRQRFHLFAERSLVPQRDNLRAKSIHSCQHRGISTCRRNVGTVGSLKKRAVLRESIDVRCRQAVIPVAAHVRGEQRVNAHQNDIRMFCSHSL